MGWAGAILLSWGRGAAPKAGGLPAAEGARAARAGAFNEPGLGGRESYLEALEVWGGNPSVIWNSALQRYIMTWHSWACANLHISSSTDLLHWAPTVQLVAVRAPRPGPAASLAPCTKRQECSLCQVSPVSSAAACWPATAPLCTLYRKLQS